jgi:hypothetical protein
VRQALGSKSVTKTIEEPYPAHDQERQKHKDKRVDFHPRAVIRIKPKVYLSAFRPLQHLLFWGLRRKRRPEALLPPVKA